MKKFSFFFLLMIPAMLCAQAPNLSGTWALNTGKSKLNTEFSMAPKQIVVEHKDNELKVEKHSTFQDQDFVTTDKFTLDGKECVNTGFMDSQKKSTANWSEDKKSLKILSKLTMGDGGEMTITEIYRMEGNNLVLDSSASSSFGELAEVSCYDKK